MEKGVTRLSLLRQLRFFFLYTTVTILNILDIFPLKNLPESHVDTVGKLVTISAWLQPFLFDQPLI